MDQMPQELIEIQQTVSALFWQVKQCAEDAHANCDNPTSGVDADQVERMIREKIFGLGNQLMSNYFKDVGTGDLGFRIKSDESIFVRKHRERETSILTGFGPVPYRHAIYYSENGESLRPLEQMINLPDRRVTYLAQEIMTRLGIQETYAESQSFYTDFFGYSPSSRTIEQVVIETASSYSVYSDENVQMPVEPTGRIGVVSFDGKGIPVVSSERTTGKTREALLGCIYTTEPETRNAEQLAKSLVLPETLSDEDKEQLHHQNRAENIQYFANIGKPKDALFSEVQRVATERFAISLPVTVVCLMDGALKLWELAHTHFSDATYILDLMHVLGYLRKAVTALEKDKKQARVLLHKYLKWILQGKVDVVIKSMRIRISKNKIRSVQALDIQRAITYFNNHSAYMRYEEYLEAGYPIATGVIESACKHIAKNRMDRSGAQWTIKGAEAVLRMRCVKATGHWHKFWKIRQKNERNRLYEKHLELAA